MASFTQSRRKPFSLSVSVLRLRSVIYMTIEAIIGFVAAIASVLGYVPQVMKSWKTHRVDDISISMVLLILFSLSSWLVYGFLKGDLPLILTNLVSLNILFLLLTAKLKFGENEFGRRWVSRPKFAFPSRWAENSTQTSDEDSEPLTKDRLRSVH